jgi:hypothetical protein
MLLTMHAHASDAERVILEPVIFSKSVDYRRDVKRGKIERDPTTDAQLAAYAGRIAR